MSVLVPVSSVDAILPKYRGTPVEMLLRYHNLDEPKTQKSPRPQVLVGTCIDYRVALRLPKGFAYVLRTAGVNLSSHEFDIAAAIGLGGVAAIALIGHTDCAMSHITQQRDTFVAGLVDRAGWQPSEAVHYFHRYASSAHIGNPTQYTLRETAKLRRRFPRVLVAPLLYRVEDDQLTQIAE